MGAHEQTQLSAPLHGPLYAPCIQPLPKQLATSIPQLFSRHALQLADPPPGANGLWHEAPPEEQPETAPTRPITAAKTTDRSVPIKRSYQTYPPAATAPRFDFGAWAANISLLMDIGKFEQQLLHLWMTTRVPLTRANIQFYVKEPRKKIEAWLQKLVTDGVLDFDSDDAGEVLWTVQGADRPKTGVTSITDLVKLNELRGSTPSSALARSAGSGLARRAWPGMRDLTRVGEGEKSLIASGALSFVLGPLGWLYAAPLQEAAPAIVVYLLLCSFLPHLLLLPLLGLIHPLSTVIGAAYAWRYNQKGARTPLLPKDTP